MEIEFKFCIPPERQDAVEAALRRGAVQRTRLQAHYFDTPAGALAAAGMALRLRKEGRRWVQTVKAAGDGPLQRWEHNAPVQPIPGGSVPQVDLLRHAGTPVGERLHAVLARADAPLAESYATDIWRLSRAVRHRGALVELALNTGRIVALASTPAPRVAPVCELELELLRGDVRGLVSLAQSWSQRCGLWFSTVSKSERGQRLLHGRDAGPPVKAMPMPPMPAGADGLALQQAAVANCLAQILPNMSDIAAGCVGAEHTHQLRIGLRRLRTALRELDALAPGIDPAWEAPLVEAFRALGAQRDQTLILPAMQAALVRAGGPAVDGAPAPTLPDPCAVVRNPAFQRVLVDLIGFTAASRAAAAALASGAASHATVEAPDGAPAPVLDPHAARRHLRDRLARLHRQVRRQGTRFETLDAEAQHGVRKRLKRLRYLAEFAAPLFDAGAVEHYLDRLRPMQDRLGTFNDDALGLARYRSCTLHDPRAWFAVGWFEARRGPAARRAQRALRRIAKAPKFWIKKKRG